MASTPTLLVIANPAAQRVTARRLRAVTAALEPAFGVETVETKGRGHAQEIAATAEADGFDLVAVLGGDGTLNEAINGLAGSGAGVTVLPAGGANVFARSIGMPRDALDAARRLTVGPNEERRVPLGRFEGRRFASNFGVGFDAEIVRHVESRPRIKRIVGDSYLVWAGLRVFLSRYDRRQPHLRVSWDGNGNPVERQGQFLAIVQNTDPYTFLGRRGIRLCPDARLGAGLGFVALDTMGLRTVLSVVMSAFGRARHTGNRHVTWASGQRVVRLECDQPMPVQMDGEFVGEHTQALVEWIPDALTVVT